MAPRLAVASLIITCAVATAAAQQSKEPTPSPTASPAPTPTFFSLQTLAEAKRLRDAALASDYAWRQTAHLANNIGPRLSGSAQEKKAIEYVAAELKALGLDVRLERVMVPHWVRGEERAALVEFPGMAPGTTQKIVLTALGGSVATPPEGLTAEVVVAKSFEELESLGREKVTGKIVLFNNAFDKQLAAQGRAGDAYSQAVVYRSDAPAAAARLGAVASLIRSVGSADFRLPHTGQTRYAEGVPSIPAGAVTTEDADLLAALTAQGRVRMQLIMTPQQLPDVESFNVVADLKGAANPGQVVIVSGHLDSWDLGTGAIDDASGVACAMQVANLVRQLKLRPRRTIRVIAWANEENGLRGARAYAAEHAAEIQDHFGGIEMDGGAGHPAGINTSGKPPMKDILKPVAKVLQEIGAGSLDVIDGAGADIGPLEKLGMPGFSPMSDNRAYFHYHHTAADTLDKIVPRELAENAAVLTVLAYALANAEQPLPR
ncbi:MAG TPA: M20/M25/M40 family metallo-hydrolase [Chthoniobacterales bacterium]|nr:M20/M25/M40 family metallo-hydrolase [Chthoniobacterales bacterium]